MKYRNHTHIKKIQKLDQTRYTIKTSDHEFVDLEMIMLLSRVYAFCKEEGHAIMDCPFVPFHIRACMWSYRMWQEH
jgi:hypothetical protein